MRRPATWLVVGALVVVVGFAAAELVLRDGDAAEPETSSQEGPDDEPEAAEARGLLYLGTETAYGCELRAVRLPDLAVESTVSVSDCRFAVAPNGSLASGGDCRAMGALATPDGAVVDLFSGCAPAWKPDGGLTFVRGGQVMAVPRDCTRTIDECAQVALSRSDIRRAFAELGRDPPAQVSVREIEWLDNTRLGLVVRRTVGSGADRRSLDFVLVFEERRFLGPLRFATGGVADLAVDRPGRRFYAAGDVVQGVAELDDWGRFVNTITLPAGVRNASSVAFAPDGAWGAATEGEAAVLFRPGDPPGAAVELPYEADALAWREP